MWEFLFIVACVIAFWSIFARLKKAESRLSIMRQDWTNYDKRLITLETDQSGQTTGKPPLPADAAPILPSQPALSPLLSPQISTLSGIQTLDRPMITVDVPSVPSDFDPTIISPSPVSPADPQPSPVLTDAVESRRQPVPALPPRSRPSWLPAWSRLERNLIENWTGILGAIILVVGVAFLGVYTALQLAASSRFLMITAVSALFLGLFYVLKRRENWLKLALWLRSGGGATFLFGCLGSGAIPGLQWIDNPQLALGLLLFGIGVNLYFGYVGNTQTIASLHVTLSVVALAVAPQSQTVLLVATLVTLFGIALAFRTRWDQHLLITIGSFSAYHLFWYFSGTPHSVDEKLVAILCNVCVGVAAACVHYRKEYETKAFEPLPFVVHLANWGLLGVGTYLNSLNSPWRGAALAAGACGAFLVARKGRDLGITWLYRTDTLIAQSLAVLAILSYRAFIGDSLTVAALLFLEVLLYVKIVTEEREPLLSTVGLVLVHGLALGLIVLAASQVNSADQALRYRHAFTLLVCLAVGTMFHLANLRRWGEDFDSLNLYAMRGLSKVRPSVSVLGVFLGIFALVAALHVYQESWFEWGALCVVGILLYIRDRWQSNGLTVGLWLALIAIHVLSWQNLATHSEMSQLLRLVHLLPLLPLTYLGVRFSYIDVQSACLRWPGIYLMGAHLAVGAYLLFNPISPLIPGVAWLVLSIGALELANAIGKRPANHESRSGEPQRFILHVGYCFVLGFFVRHLMVDLQSEPYLGPVHIRLLIEAFGIAVCLYWWLCKPGPALDRYKNWLYVHPLFLEAALLLCITIVLTEVAQTWQPLVWALVALALLMVRSPSPAYSRVRLYSLLFVWASALHLAAGTAISVAGTVHWYEATWMTGMLAIGLQFVYLWQAHRRLNVEHMTFPPSLSLVSRWRNQIDRRTHLWIYYPVFIGITLGLYVLFNPISPLIPGVLWLCLSVFALELANHVSATRAEALTQDRAPERFILHIGYLYVVAFLVQHVLVHLQAEVYLGPIPARLLIEILALAVCLYWWVYIPTTTLEGYKDWKYFHPLFLELALGVFIMTVLVEVSPRWHPVYWIVAALLFLWGRHLPILPSRSRFYSLVFSWMSTFHVAILTASGDALPSLAWHEQAWFTGVMAIGLQFVYLWFAHHHLDLDSIDAPPSLAALTRSIAVIHRRKHLWIYYPVVICMAIFLYSNFDRSVLTLLWVLEAFAVFVLSIVLKEQHFRYMALTALGVCLMRLVTYDLAKSDTLTRAVVFLGVGLTMLLMHSVYNKFRDRFS